MGNFSNLGAAWLADEVDLLTEEMENLTPSEYNERTRYLPASVTSKPGFIRYSVNPFMREIVDCFDVNSPVREVSVKKGVQITYSTLLESGILYYADYIGTLPMMYVTADKELATARIENNMIPMFNQSDLGHIIRSSDEGNSRKTGKTKNHMQFAKGAYLIPFGAKNADKMRSFSIAVMLKDEVDAWPLTVGKDGDPDALTNARTDGYTNQAKIFRGSTPLMKGSSAIQKAYERGDQRKYMILCKACSFPQYLTWHFVNKESGIIGGFVWDYDSDGTLITESTRYCCIKCGHEHFEHDKEYLFKESNGAHWKPTARATAPNVRSYHLPAFYSPIGMRPWSKCVVEYLDAYDPINKKVRDVARLQTWINNVKAEPFEQLGGKITFMAASAHRRTDYKKGQIPNSHAETYAGSKILFLTCQVDVHKSNLAVSVMGWTAGQRCYVIDYKRIESEDCSDLTAKCWGELRELIEETTFDGYKIAITLIDAGYSNDTVVNFCKDYEWGVFPILGRDRTAKNQSIKEFGEFKTSAGTIGYRILVDHYKDRLAPVLRREWREEDGEQSNYHFNAPYDVTDSELKELTTEYKREEKDPTGNIYWRWYRPGNAANEFWDLLVYGHAAFELFAWMICIKHFELEQIDWAQFFEYCSDPVNDGMFGRAVDSSEER